MTIPAIPGPQQPITGKLRAQGAEVETVFWPDDHQPPLGHEYQFDPAP
jgi:acetyl esterase